jgi:hypothetical protein
MEKYLLKPSEQPWKFAFRLLPVQGKKPPVSGVFKIPA